MEGYSKEEINLLSEEGIKRKHTENMTENILPVQNFETLSIDVANKKFLINGKDFGKN